MPLCEIQGQELRRVLRLRAVTGLTVCSTHREFGLPTFFREPLLAFPEELDRRLAVVSDAVPSALRPPRGLARSLTFSVRPAPESGNDDAHETHCGRLSTGLSTAPDATTICSSWPSRRLAGWTIRINVCRHDTPAGCSGWSRPAGCVLALRATVRECQELSEPDTAD